MSRDTTVIPFRQPEAIDDPLSELAREGARRMLAPGAGRGSRLLCRHVEGPEIAGWPRRWRELLIDIKQRGGSAPDSTMPSRTTPAAR
jgi:hypothetical protein